MGVLLSGRGPRRNLIGMRLLLSRRRYTNLCIVGWTTMFVAHD